jgi:hypothetical protein
MAEPVLDYLRVDARGRGGSREQYLAETNQIGDG